MMIQAIVIDGFHEGHVVSAEYHPTIRLMKPKSITVDYCCNNEEYTDDELHSEMEEYKECFRSVDRNVVLYSTKGESHDFMKGFIRQFTSKPWTKNTTLYFGYHNEPVRRTDGEDLERKIN